MPVSRVPGVRWILILSNLAGLLFKASSYGVEITATGAEQVHLRKEVGPKRHHLGLAVDSQSSQRQTSGLHDSDGMATAMDHFRFLAAAASNDSMTVDPQRLQSSMQSLAKQLAQSKPLVSSRITVKPFLMLSQQRSGTDFVLSLLNTHPAIVVLSNSTEYFARRVGSLQDAFDEVQRSVSFKAARLVGHGEIHIGTKLMANQLQQVVKGPLFTDDVKVIFHWRRNVLRQIISNQANMVIISRSLKHDAHPTSKQKADAITQLTKPELRGGDLLPTVETLLAERCKVMRKAAASLRQSSMCPTSHYEDWLSPSTRVQTAAAVESCLGVSQNGTRFESNLQVLHANTPIELTVKNPAVLEEVFRRSKFAYMLNGTSEMTDVYETQC